MKRHPPILGGQGRSSRDIGNDAVVVFYTFLGIVGVIACAIAAAVTS